MLGNGNMSGPNGKSKCPEFREMDFGHFWETYVSIMFWNLKSKCLFEKLNIRWLIRPNCQVKKLYSDPLTLKFSLKSDLFIDNFPDVVCVLCFSVTYGFQRFQYKTCVPKKSQIFRHLFEPCSSSISGKKPNPDKGNV